MLTKASADQHSAIWVNGDKFELSPEAGGTSRWRKRGLGWVKSLAIHSTPTVSLNDLQLGWLIDVDTEDGPRS